MTSPTDRNWVCYLLRCVDDTLYCGITNDLDKRLAAHNAGTAAKYTRSRGPVELAYVESCDDKSAALKRELTIKALSRAAKLELIITRQRKSFVQADATESGNPQPSKLGVELA